MSKEVKDKKADKIITFVNWAKTKHIIISPIVVEWIGRAGPFQGC
jgi:hypothetical protein